MCEKFNEMTISHNNYISAIGKQDNNNNILVGVFNIQIQS